MLNFNGEPFTTAWSTYQDNNPADVTCKIKIPVRFGDLPPCLANLDTGAPYPIMSKSEAQEIGIDLIRDSILPFTLIFLGLQLKGLLVRCNVTFIAEEGESLTVEATVFVPEDENVNPGNFLGYDGLLQRIVFALDPRNNTFHFGSI